ncbi:MAG: hypothetical protein EOP06_23550 [Proteobacteria bacterium]|nr:MAG: hypothetical protein EOP06_23550 [Pseudomonadota bacterium]
MKKFILAATLVLSAATANAANVLSPNETEFKTCLEAQLKTEMRLNSVEIFNAEILQNFPSYASASINADGLAYSLLLETADQQGWQSVTVNQTPAISAQNVLSIVVRNSIGKNVVTINPKTCNF